MTIGEQLGSRPAFIAETVWRDRASCRYLSPALFFPAGVTGVAADEIAWAKGVCASCAVQNECLQFAFETNQEAGIWGGTTEDERRKLRRAWLARRRRPTRTMAKTATTSTSNAGAPSG